MATNQNDDLLQDEFESAVQAMFDRVTDGEIVSELPDKYREDDRILNITKMAVINVMSTTLCKRIIEMAEELVDRLHEE